MAKDEEQTQKEELSTSAATILCGQLNFVCFLSNKNPIKMQLGSIVSKNLSFCLSAPKYSPTVFKLKLGQLHVQKSVLWAVRHQTRGTNAVKLTEAQRY